MRRDSRETDDGLSVHSCWEEVRSTANSSVERVYNVMRDI